MKRGRGPRVRSATPFAVAAIVFLVFGLLGVLVELQSPSLVYWTGEHTTGTNNGGLIYYSVDGQHYTIDAPGPPPAQPVPAEVFFKGNDPSQALPDKPVRWFDATVVLSPFVAAAASLTIWARRRAKARHNLPG